MLEQGFWGQKNDNFSRRVFALPWKEARKIDVMELFMFSSHGRRRFRSERFQITHWKYIRVYVIADAYLGQIFDILINKVINAYRSWAKLIWEFSISDSASHMIFLRIALSLSSIILQWISENTIWTALIDQLISRELDWNNYKPFNWIVSSFVFIL